MNLEKAREYFSAHYEGTLEKGLAEAFERALRTDAQIQAEYRAFERLMSDLEALKSPVPEPEVDLHELISRRLDLHIHEQKRRAPAGLIGWWRSIAIGGLATAALVMAVLQMREAPTATGGRSTASIGSLAAATEKLGLHEFGNGYRLEYSTKGVKTIVIRSVDGGILEEKLLKSGTFLSPLSNPNEKAKLLQVDVQGDSPVFIALPGTKMQTVSSGEGSLKDLALAMAGHYRQPVTLTLGEDIKLKWNFDNSEPVAAADQVLAGTRYSVHQSEDGVVSIRPN